MSGREQVRSGAGIAERAAAEAGGVGMLHWLWLSAVVLLVDQVTKQLAHRLLEWNQPLEILPIFNIRLRYNPGAAFSLLSDADGWQRWFFFSLGTIASVVIIVWLRQLPRQAVGNAVGLALILSGAVGNAIDRLWSERGVVDFLDFHYGTYAFPTFNVADSAITIGAVILLWDLWRNRDSY